MLPSSCNPFLTSLHPASKFTPLNQNMHFTCKFLVLSSLFFVVGSLNTLLQLAEFAFKFHRLLQRLPGKALATHLRYLTDCGRAVIIPRSLPGEGSVGSAVLSKSSSDPSFLPVG